MMKFRHVLLAGAASAALIGSAAAETLPMVPQTGVVALSDFFYMSIGGTAQVIELPKFNYGRNVNIPTAIITDAYAEHNRIITGGPAITIGYNLPWNIGTRPRVEFAAMANFGHMRDQTTASFPLATTGTFLTQIDDGAIIVGTPVSSQRIDLSATYENADGVVRFKTDIPIGATFVLSPSIGPIFGYTQTRYDMTSRSNVLGVVDYTSNLKEVLTQWRGGGEVGLDATLSLGQNFKLHGGMTGAGFFQHARVKARDCVQAAPTDVPACSLPTPGPSVLVTNASRSDDNFGVRAGASLGATVSTGWMNITFMGTGAYNINVPSIENPRYPEQPQKGVKIGWEDRFTYGGYIMATFPLN
ncbi:MAG: hypothetical protein AB7G15_05905 [Alphaproteobacteria bacterium]